MTIPLLPSLRGSPQGLTKQSIKTAESLKDSNDSIESNHNIDCHDSATPNLAMTAKGDSADSSDSIESNSKIDCYEAFTSRNDFSPHAPRKL